MDKILNIFLIFDALHAAIFVPYDGTIVAATPSCTQETGC
jgi:hypothetical protein